MRFAGDLVTLRGVELDDVPLHHAWFNDPEVSRWLGLRYPLSVAAVERRATVEPSFADTRLTVVANDTGAVVGLTALRGATPENRDAELDLVIGERSAWGRGYGTDATRATCRYAFERLGLHRVHLWVFPENASAVRIYERVGFVHEAVARDRLFRHGRWHDCLLMGLLREELR